MIDFLPWDWISPNHSREEYKREAAEARMEDEELGIVTEEEQWDCPE